MNDKTLYEILRTIVPKIPSGTSWRLEGSTNLRVQGVQTTVNDVDIVTDNLDIFREILSEYIQEDVYKKSIQSHVLVCEIQGCEVEILDYEQEEIRYLDKVQKQKFRDVDINILPLEYAKEFYTQIGRQSKVELINAHIQR
jgi:hypothetical protein